MKKLIGIGIAAMMVMGLGVAANANYIIKADAVSSKGDGFKSTLTWATGSAANTGYVQGLNPTPIVAGLSNNDPTLDPKVAKNLVSAFKTKTEPLAWYGTIFGENGYSGDFNVKFYATTSTSYLPTGTWYLYKGIGTVVNGNMTGDVVEVAEGTFSTNVSSYALSTFGYKFANNDVFTLSTAKVAAVPEPGSIVAMLSGLVGLAGFGIRRKK